MNKSILFGSLIAILGVTTSCVENSGKYKTLLAEKDSIYQSEMQIKAEYDYMIELIEDIEDKFNSINEAENQVMIQIENPEAKRQLKKEMITEQISMIKNIIDENQTKIGELESQLSKSRNQNSALKKTITRLQDELKLKTEKLEKLYAELEKKDIQINELNCAVSCLTENNDELMKITDSQQEALEELDADINTVWYVVGDSKKLKTLELLKGNGIFKSSSLNNEKIDNSKVEKADLRTLNVIETKSKKPKFLSNHPLSSYRLAITTEKLINIEILDPAKFWSVSKYLVIKE